MSPVFFEGTEFISGNGKLSYMPSVSELANKLKRIHDDDDDAGIHISFSFFIFLLIPLESDESIKKSKISYSPTSPQYSPHYNPHGWTSPTYKPNFDTKEYNSPQYSPTSPQYESREEEEEVPNTFEPVFFHNLVAPTKMNSDKDAFCLDPDNDRYDEHVSCYADIDAKRNVFAWGIDTYDHGVAISKHCGPWGELGVLNNQSFTIEKKIYNTKHNIVFVIIREVSSPHREFLLEPAFFDGWLLTSYVL